MALTDTIQCDGVTTAFTLTRAVTTKESLSLTIASGDDAGLVVSPSDYTFSPVNSASQSVTITWANAVNYGTVGTPVDVTVAIYHNPGADPADTLLYSYDSASAMRPEMVGRDMEHIIDLVKMVIGGADLATTSLGDQEDDIAALDVRLDAAEATIVTHTSQIAVLDGRLDTAEPILTEAVSDISVLEAAVSDLLDLTSIPNPYVPILPSGTKILFSGTLPTGWTQDTAAALNGAMLVGTTSVASSGGSADPKTMAHGHTFAHTHTTPQTDSAISLGNLATWNLDAASGANKYTPDQLSLTRVQAMTTDSQSTTAVPSTSISPKYYEVMVGVKT